MEIKTKYDLKQKVWFIHNNKIVSLSIRSISYKCFPGVNGYEEILYGFFTNESENILVLENRIFISKEDLINDLTQ